MISNQVGALAPRGPGQPGPPAHEGRVRVAIGGVHIEASAFSPHRTRLQDFKATRQADLLARYAWTSDGNPWASDVEWAPLVHAVALPGGAVLAPAYEALKEELVSRAAAAGRLDGLLLDLHGAMTVEGMEDAEADLVRALRRVVGPDVLISAAMDLHGNVSRQMAGLLDLLTCYRTAPHVDTWETRERAARNLVAQLRRGGRPAKAWVRVPVLLPGEKTSTRTAPASRLYADVASVADLPGVLDAALWVGYAWGDEPRCHASVAVTGDDADIVRQEAERLARAYWDARQQFAFAAPAADFATCLRQAKASAKRPFFISDSGDNPTAGGAGDTSCALAQMLAPGNGTGGCSAILASVVDPEAVSAATVAGVGAPVELSVGGKIDRTEPGPVPVSGTVRALYPDDDVGGDIAVVSQDRVDVVLTSRRKPYHRLTDFSVLGLSPLEADIVVVKIGYLEPELYQAAADWVLALTPGGVDQDLPRLGHRRLGRPVYPLDPAMETPTFEAWTA